MISEAAVLYLSWRAIKLETWLAFSKHKQLPATMVMDFNSKLLFLKMSKHNNPTGLMFRWSWRVNELGYYAHSRLVYSRVLFLLTRSRFLGRCCTLGTILCYFKTVASTEQISSQLHILLKSLKGVSSTEPRFICYLKMNHKDILMWGTCANLKPAL